MEKDDDKKLAMIKAVSEVLKIKKGRKNATHEQIMGEMDEFVHKTKEKDSRLMMIVAASKTLDVLERNPKMSDREIIKQMVSDFDLLIEGAKDNN